MVFRSHRAVSVTAAAIVITVGPVGVGASAEPDQSTPSQTRQVELRQAADINRANDRPPYAGVRVATRGELEWIMAVAEEWGGRLDAYTVKYNPPAGGYSPADLRGANFSHVALGDVWLRMADLRGANLVYAGLRGAHLRDAQLAGADLGRGDLEGAELGYVNLADAHLREAKLVGANLQYANLAGARMYQVDLRGTTLRGARMNPATVFSPAKMDTATRLGDVIWDNVALIHAPWSMAKRLGDEVGIKKAIKDGGRRGAKRLAAEEAAVRAYRQLSIVLQAQGLAEVAAIYAYRAQVLRRRSLGRRWRLGRWLGSWMLAVLAGYGYKLWRIVTSYVVVVLLCAAAYFALGYFGYGSSISPQEALFVSVTAFHGRVFTQPFVLLSPQEWVTAIEGIAGVVIEGVFVAMLVQRVFLTK